MRNLTREELQAELSAHASEILKAWRNRHKVNPKRLASEARAARRDDLDVRFIYIIGHNRTSVKIGIAKDVRKRRKALQTASAQGLIVHFKAICPPKMAPTVERECHKALRLVRSKGEWFNVSPETAEVIVQRIVAAAWKSSEHDPADFGHPI